MYSVPVMNTKDKNVEFPDYLGFSVRIWRILGVFGITVDPAVSSEKNNTSLTIFLIIRGIPKGRR